MHTVNAQCKYTLCIYSVNTRIYNLFFFSGSGSAPSKGLSFYERPMIRCLTRRFVQTMSRTTHDGQFMITMVLRHLYVRTGYWTKLVWYWANNTLRIIICCSVKKRKYGEKNVSHFNNLSVVFCSGSVLFSKWSTIFILIYNYKKILLNDTCILIIAQ